MDPCPAPECERFIDATQQTCCWSHWLALPKALRQKLNRVAVECGRDHQNFRSVMQKAERVWLGLPPEAHLTAPGRVVNELAS